MVRRVGSTLTGIVLIAAGVVIGVLITHNLQSNAKPVSSYMNARAAVRIASGRTIDNSTATANTSRHAPYLPRNTSRHAPYLPRNTSRHAPYLPRNKPSEDKIAADPVSEADVLFRKVRVLCWVMTSPSNYKFKSKPIRDTWGKRCNVLLYMSENRGGVVNDEDLVQLDVQPGREHLNDKTMLAFDYIYKYYIESADWFIKVDDDTFVIPENLRLMLAPHDSRKAFIFGQHFKVNNLNYFSGGAGYVISKGSLELFGKRDQKKDCVRNSIYEDIALSKCLQSLGVKMLDSRDAEGRGRFHCFAPHRHLHGKFPDWYHKYDHYHNGTHGLSSLSEFTVSFHYISPLQMYELDLLIYHLRPYGLAYKHRNINPTLATSLYNT